MRCPKCHADDTKVIDSRDVGEGSSIRRRRLCPACGHRFTTYERLEEVPLVVLKSSGVREPFDRNKIVAGVSAAAKGRPVSVEQIDRIADEIEDLVRIGGELTTAQIGIAVLDRLRCVDEVAYLRFAELVLLKKLQNTPAE
jgi:transcriptional repressor NrdR